MTVKDFRWLFVAALAVFLLVSNVAKFQALGITSQSSSDGTYRFGGGTGPWGLIIAATLVGLYLLFMNARPVELGRPMPTVFRRFIAFWLDFVLALTAIVPIVGIAPALAEWRRTGIFQWSFERTTHASGDTLLAASGLLVGAACLILYFALPLVLRKPSPGTCILGYQIVPDADASMSLRSAVLRTLLGLVAIGVWFTAPFVARDSNNGKFWLDKVFRTRAVRLA